MGEFSLWHILILLFIVLLLFGPSRLPNLGNSMGKAIRGFKEGLKGLEEDQTPEERTAQKAPEALPPVEKKTTTTTTTTTAGTSSNNT